MQSRACHLVIGPGADCAAGKIREVLRQSGIAVEQWSGGPCHGVAIVAVHDGAAASCAVMRDACARIRGRRLALVTGTTEPDPEPGATTALVRAGADEVMGWAGPGESGEALRALIRRWQTIEETLAAPVIARNLIGTSEAWVRAIREVIEAALFGQAPVLLTGETGTGKELLARLVHTLDQRPGKGDLIVVDCTTLARELLGSELFGHERGAFTGAVAERAGAVALANHGTLFLDEVGELPLEVQAQLLRVLQEKIHKRVGGDVWLRSEFRLVAATNRDLPADVAKGRFRQDLYHRIAGCTCRLPALAQRRDDIELLVAHFLGEALGSATSPALGAVVREHLRARAYPGNVRELKQLVCAMARRYVGAGPVTIGTLPDDERGRLAIPGNENGDWRNGTMEQLVREALAGGAGLKEIGRAVEDAAVRIAIRECGSVRGAAAKLQVTERALQLRRTIARRAGDDSSA